jgi:hypothetical protein
MIKFHQPTPDQSLIKAAEQSHHAWNVEQEAKDVEAAAALYTEDATLESPLTSNRQGNSLSPEGSERVLAGCVSPIEITYLPTGQHRCENPRATPEGDQMDFAEVMEIKGGTIHRQRVYWGLVRSSHSDD